MKELFLKIAKEHGLEILDDTIDIISNGTHVVIDLYHLLIIDGDFEYSSIDRDILTRYTSINYIGKSVHNIKVESDEVIYLSSEFIIVNSEDWNSIIKCWRNFRIEKYAPKLTSIKSQHSDLMSSATKVDDEQDKQQNKIFNF